MKRHITRTFTSISAVAAVFWLAASVADAQTSPVFEYNFPASWSGTGTTITDVSPAANDGHLDGTLSLDVTVPPGAAAGTLSVDTSAGGILTNANALLTNAAIAAAGGFTYDISFMWNGTDSSSFGHTEKLIDYAGTESLQLVTSAGMASLQMAFADDVGNESVPVSTIIAPNTWYNVRLDFGNTSLAGTSNQDVAGTATMYVNGSYVASAPAIKGTEGDSLNRPIGVGQLGANFGYLVGFKGDIYDPSVSLGVVPEPSTLAFGALGGLGMMFPPLPEILMLTALHVAEEVCLAVPRRQVVLTIPKRLRPHTRFDRSLLGKLCAAAWTCVGGVTRKSDIEGILKEIHRQGIKPVVAIKYERQGNTLPVLRQCIAFYEKTAVVLGG